jgi:hypothetical protein
MAGIPEVQRFAREAGDGEVSRVAGRHAARWNERDLIAPQDLPIPTGLPVTEIPRQVF